MFNHSFFVGCEKVSLAQIALKKSLLSSKLPPSGISHSEKNYNNRLVDWSWNDFSFTQNDFSARNLPMDILTHNYGLRPPKPADNGRLTFTLGLGLPEFVDRTRCVDIFADRDR